MASSTAQWASAAFVPACPDLAGTTGLALPQLDLPAFHYGGAWASANSLVFTDLFKVGREGISLSCH